MSALNFLLIISVAAHHLETAFFGFSRMVGQGRKCILLQARGTLEAVGQIRAQVAATNHPTGGRTK